MKVCPITSNYQKPVFKSKFVPTKEFNAFQETLAKADYPFFKNYAEVFKIQYEKFLNDGKNISYKYFHKKTDLPPSRGPYNRPGVELKAVIESENGKVIDSALMDLQIKTNERIIKPNFTIEMKFFQKFLNFPKEHAPFYLSDIDHRFVFYEDVKRVVRPYSTEDFVKEPFIPDL